MEEQTEEQVICAVMEEMVTFIWDIMIQSRKNSSTSIDELRAKMLAIALGQLLDWYEMNKGNLLSETTIWMIRQVVESVDEITSKSITVKATIIVTEKE